jgi:hypothetical protein
MGYVFEELIRKFNEENNEEAGEHFTPREVIKLMTHLVFDPIVNGHDIFHLSGHVVLRFQTDKIWHKAIRRMTTVFYGGTHDAMSIVQGGNRDYGSTSSQKDEKDRDRCDAWSQRGHSPLPSQAASQWSGGRSSQQAAQGGGFVQSYRSLV